MCHTTQSYNWGRTLHFQLKCFSRNKTVEALNNHLSSKPKASILNAATVPYMGVGLFLESLTLSLSLSLSLSPFHCDFQPLFCVDLPLSRDRETDRQTNGQTNLVVIAEMAYPDVLVKVAVVKVVSQPAHLTPVEVPFPITASPWTKQQTGRTMKNKHNEV